jgi:hypothetical protein
MLDLRQDFPSEFQWNPQLASAWENLHMAREALPTAQQLVDDLRKVARNGLGRALPRLQGAQAIPHLSAAAVELADDPNEAFPVLVAKLVTQAVRDVKPDRSRIAITEILWIDLEKEDGWKEGEDPNGKVPPLTGHGNRYSKAAECLERTTYDVENNLSRPLLEAAGDRIVALLKAHRKEMAATASPPSRKDDSANRRPEDGIEAHTGPPIIFVGTIGVLLVTIGLAWLIATATGAVS